MSWPGGRAIFRPMAKKPDKDSTPKPRPSRGKSGKPIAPRAETAAGTPGFGEQSQATFTASGPLLEQPEIFERLRALGGAVPSTSAADPPKKVPLPALRSVKPRPEDFSPSAGLNALLAKPEERSDRAKELLSLQPMIASHPLVAGTVQAYTPHRPARPEKSEGGIRFKLVSEFEPKGDQPQAIKELVEGVLQRDERDQVLLGPWRETAGCRLRRRSVALSARQPRGVDGENERAETLRRQARHGGGTRWRELAGSRRCRQLRLLR